MRSHFNAEWRTKSPWKRKFYSKYMTWLERIGYVVVVAVIVAFVAAFNFKVDDLVTADKVKIEPFATVVSEEQPVVIVKSLAKDFDKVSEGQALLEIVRGEEAIRRFKVRIQLQVLRDSIGTRPEIQALESSLGGAETETVRAPKGGNFRFDEKTIMTQIEPGTELCRVVDYSDLRLSANLAGQTVGQAKIGQVAKLSGILVESSSGTLFRGDSPAGATISGQLFEGQVKDALKKGLTGYAVHLKDDVPLQITDVSDVQVDARVGQDPSNGQSGGVPLDPEVTYSLTAIVTEGSPKATVQLSALPASLQQEAAKLVSQQVKGKRVQRLDGSQAKLTQPSDIRFVVKLNADALAKPGATEIAASQLTRTFDAKLKINSPPQFLRDAVEKADRAGKTVTAKVELKTSTRPIALILLRKS